jgi:hypothetical protein
MANQYILPADYAAYGLPNTTTPEQVAHASLIVDVELNRPAGCLYATDVYGNPVYMTGLNTQLTLTATAPIAPGFNVIVPATGPLRSLISANTFGQTVVLDKGDDTKREICVISGVDVTNGTVTLSNVLFAHDADTLLEAGLTIVEERFLITGRSVANVSYTPVQRVVGVQAQITYPRTGSLFNYLGLSVSPLNYFGALGVNSGVPIFQTLNVDDVETTAGSGLLYFPGALDTGFYNNVRVNYIAGWTYDSLPNAIKQATAQIVILNNSPDINVVVAGPVTKYRAGGTEVDFANSKATTSATFLNANSIPALLAPYVRSYI